MPNRNRAVAIFLLISGAAIAQHMQFGGPISGYIYDMPTRSVRAVLGVPGTSYIGPAVMEDVDLAEVSPAGELALVWSSGTLRLIRNLENPAHAEILQDRAVLPTRVTWSPDASAVMLYTEGRIQVIRNLTGDAQFEDRYILPEGDISTLALGPGGKCSAIGIRSIESGGVFVVCPEVPPIRILDAQEPSAAVFSNSGHLYTADRALGRVFEIRHAERMPAVIAFPAEPGAEVDAAGLGLSRDNRILYIADRNSSSIRALDTSDGHVVATIPLDVPPESFRMLASRIFQLNSRTKPQDVIFVFTAEADPHAYFVPFSN